MPAPEQPSEPELRVLEAVVHSYIETAAPAAFFGEEVVRAAPDVTGGRE